MDVVFRHFLIPGNVVDGPVRELIVIEDMDDDKQYTVCDLLVALPDISSSDGSSNDISNVFFFLKISIVSDVFSSSKTCNCYSIE